METDMKPEPQMNKYFYIAGWILIAMMTIGAAIIYIKGKTILNYVPPCMFHKITGLYCPGCGGTRAVFSFFRGEIVRSFKFHPLVPYTFILGGWFMLSQTIEYLSKGKLSIALHFRQVYMWIGIFLIVVNCLVKNLVKYIWGISLMT